jgi:hypothetical protein
MSSWRDSILRHFEPGVARLTLVSDPDALLTEEGVLTEIGDCGYDVVTYEDEMAFRYVYESDYRQAWDNGEDVALVVAVQTGEALDCVPYDVYSQSRHLSFALHDLFPTLNYPVIRKLDRALLDKLYEAYQKHDGGKLGQRSTKEFVLRACYSVAPDLVGTPADLMRFLLQRHYNRTALPEELDELLLRELNQKPALQAFPLEDILPNREGFFRYVQEQWERYLEIGETIIPFEHNEVRVYLDNLFAEGILRPVETQQDVPEWAQLGVAGTQVASEATRYRRLLERVEAEMPDENGSHRDWQRMSELWGELTALRWESDEALSAEEKRHFEDIHHEVEAHFAEWMLDRFGSLSQMPMYPNPVMAHQIAPYLAAQLNEVERVALIVLDGMAQDQWVIARRELQRQQETWQFDTAPVFSWVPTLTPVARQAIFAGVPPLRFADSLTTTSKDAIRWEEFWRQHGLEGRQVHYALHRPARERIIQSIDLSEVRALGVVVPDIDEMLHGQKLGTQDLHQSVGLWARQGHLSRLLDDLDEAGFATFITSDHGNVHAVGSGTIREGVLVGTPGTRARVYDDASLLNEAAAANENCMRWTGAGLPDDYHVLLADGLNAFTAKGDSVVTHGGIALEEVVVPFVRVRTDDSDGM